MATRAWDAAEQRMTGEPRAGITTGSRTPPWHHVLIPEAGTEPTGLAREPALREVPDGRRVRLADVSVAQSGLSSTVRVTLSADGTTFVGSAESVAALTSRRTATARATADAVNELLGGDVRVEVMAVDLLRSPTRIVVSLLLVTAAETEILLGAALEGDRADHGIARATLDAVNRRLMIARD